MKKSFHRVGKSFTNSEKKPISKFNVPKYMNYIEPMSLPEIMKGKNEVNLLVAFDLWRFGYMSNREFDFVYKRYYPRHLENSDSLEDDNTLNHMHERKTWEESQYTSYLNSYGDQDSKYLMPL